jgi:hypothetical protein
MPGWLRSVGSGPLTWMRSNATSTAWRNPHPWTGRRGDEDDQSRAVRTECGQRGAVRKDGEKWTLVLVRELHHSPEKVWQALTEPLIAHVSVGDGPEAWGWAAATGVLWGLSYFFWRRLEATPASALTRVVSTPFATETT